MAQTIDNMLPKKLQLKQMRKQVEPIKLWSKWKENLFLQVSMKPNGFTFYWFFFYWNNEPLAAQKS